MIALDDRTRSLGWGLALLFAASICAGPGIGDANAAPPTPDTQRLRYLYVEANEGVASGGHVGLRIDGDVFHFQHRDGLLSLQRTNADRFVHAYARLGNRGIEETTLSVSPAVVGALRRSFDDRLRIQRAETRHLESLQRAHEILEAWTQSKPTPLRIPALGYFDARASGPPSPAFERLLERIARQNGEGFLGARRAATDTALIASLEPGAAHWSRTYVALAGQSAALDVLHAKAPLDPERLVTADGAQGAFRPGERRAVLEAMESVEARLVELSTSKRIDWGRPFLIGLARLLVMEASLRAGRWIWLDTLPETAAGIPGAVLSARPETLEGVTRAAEGALDAARARWTHADRATERDYTRLENAANRLIEIRASQAQERDLRTPDGVLLPLRPALPWHELPRRSDPDVSAEADAAGERVRAYRAKLESARGYQLIRRNCVSELFAVLEQTLRDAGDEALGATLAPQAGLGFIPAISSQRVRSGYRVATTRSIPSERTRLITQMRSREHPLWVGLRESNTLTAQSYGAGHEDSFFLFFADVPRPLRPAVGVLNIGAGLGFATLGLPRAPWDQGDRVRRGFAGAFSSLPELVGFGIRKGSNTWVSPIPESPARSDLTASSR